MSFNLPDHVELPTSPARHNLAIAEIAIFGAILPFQFFIKLMQEWQHWGIHHKHRRHPIRCFFRAWFSILAILCQSKFSYQHAIQIINVNVNRVHTVRIIGFALYISTKDPAKSVVVAEVILQSVGTSPLLWELSLVLLRWYVFFQSAAKSCCSLRPRLLTAFLTIADTPATSTTRIRLTQSSWKRV